ncbi:hypothetical protein HAX54_003249, partial [Datura stramonium]|nr:hypothetical protein [Datura stramonium]
QSRHSVAPHFSFTEKRDLTLTSLKESGKGKKGDAPVVGYRRWPEVRERNDEEKRGRRGRRRWCAATAVTGSEEKRERRSVRCGGRRWRFWWSGSVVSPEKVKRGREGEGGAATRLWFCSSARAEETEMKKKWWPE